MSTYIKKLNKYLSKKSSHTEMLSMETTAHFLGADRRTIHKWIKELRIPTFKDDLDRRKTLILGRMVDLIERRMKTKIKSGWRTRVPFNPLFYTNFQGTVPSSYWVQVPKYMKYDRKKYPGKVKAYLKRVCCHTEMVSRHRLSRNSIYYWVKKLNIQLYNDAVDRRKRLIVFYDLCRIWREQSD